MLVTKGDQGFPHDVVDLGHLPVEWGREGEEGEGEGEGRRKKGGEEGRRKEERRGGEEGVERGEGKECKWKEYCYTSHLPPLSLSSTIAASLSLTYSSWPRQCEGGQIFGQTFAGRPYSSRGQSENILWTPQKIEVTPQSLTVTYTYY